jgi:hypothetical protein
MKKNVLILMVGLALGVLVALPLTVMASSWSLPFMASVNGQAQDAQGQQEPTPPPPTATPVPPVQAQEGQGQERKPSKTHQQMHEMMDAMHGEGTSQRMHEAMPGSEKMMENCASMMDRMGNMEGMMNGMSGMGR